MRNAITKADVFSAISSWPSMYETKDGERITGCRVSEMPARLRDTGWRNVPRYDASDFEKLGCRIVRAQYVGGAHKTGRFIDVVVREDLWR